MIYFGADALGISISELIIKAIIPFKPFTFGLVAIIFPSALGILLAWYCIHSLRRSTNITFRLIVLMGAFTIFQFGDVYIKAIDATGFIIDKAFVPNLVFTISVSLYIIFRYDTKQLHAK